MRLEADAYDVKIPDLIRNEEYEQLIEFLTQHSKYYLKVSEDVRKRLAEVNEDQNLFNASFETIVPYIGSMEQNEYDRADADKFLKQSY